MQNLRRISADFCAVRRENRRDSRIWCGPRNLVVRDCNACFVHELVAPLFIVCLFSKTLRAHFSTGYANFPARFGHHDEASQTHGQAAKLEKKGKGTDTRVPVALSRVSKSRCGAATFQ